MLCSAMAATVFTMTEGYPEPPLTGLRWGWRLKRCERVTFLWFGSLIG